MRIKKYFKKITVSALFLFQLSAFSLAQANNSPAPREEKLLNGLKLLVWSDKNAEKVSVKLRIHSGAAFDPQGKEGVMALLSDILYPNETAKEYFTEDLGGSLEITSNYDYIQINATGDNDKILEILESIAQALTAPLIDKDTTAKVKAARLEKVKELEKNPSYLADQAVAKHLFGNFPYGRARFGTTETLAKIDFADILLAKQKFLTADNATLAVSGNVKSDLVFRATRRYFGGWTKADKKVPATFTQPSKPSEKLQMLNVPSIEDQIIYFATESVARNDKDFFAYRILTKIYENRPKKSASDFVKGESYLLKGIFVIGGKPELTTLEASQNKPPKPQISQQEFDKAKADVLADLSQKNLSDYWLDVETYKLASIKDELQTANNVKLEDVQRVSDKLETQPKAIVFVSKGVEASTKTN